MSERSAALIRIAVVGTGHVGATFAYALLLSGLAAEIVLIDVDRARAEGEAMDLNHTVPFARPTRVWAGEYKDCAGATITVVCAGTGQRPGETRLDLLKRNAEIFGEVIPEIARHNPEGILLIATNPVDILTYVSLRLSKLPARRVIGSGTILDTARFPVSAEPPLQRGCAKRACVHHRRAWRQRSAGVVAGEHRRAAAEDFAELNGTAIDESDEGIDLRADAGCGVPHHRA